MTQTGHIDLLCAIDLSCVQRCVSNSVHHGSNVLRLVSSLSTATADAGDAAEDPGSDAHLEGRLLTQDSIHTSCNCKNSNTDALHHHHLLPPRSSACVSHPTTTQPHQQHITRGSGTHKEVGRPPDTVTPFISSETHAKRSTLTLFLPGQAFKATKNK